MLSEFGKPIVFIPFPKEHAFLATMDVVLDLADSDLPSEYCNYQLEDEEID